MDTIRNSPSLIHEQGKYTVDVISERDLMTFEEFQIRHPQNPMRYSIPNRNILRGKLKKRLQYNKIS